MIIRENKRFETNSLYPNTDWYNEGNYVVDETTEEGRILADKIIEHAPYFEYVLDKQGNLIDITPTERPPAPEPKPTDIELLELNMYEAVAVVYEEQLNAQLDNYEAIAEVYETMMSLVGGVE